MTPSVSQHPIVSHQNKKLKYDLGIPTLGRREWGFTFTEQHDNGIKNNWIEYPVK